MGAAGTERRVVVALALALAVIASCANPPVEVASGPSTVTAPSGSSGASTGSPGSEVGGSAPPAFAIENCPVRDEAFCEVAVVAVNAVVSGDAEAIVGISRPGTYDCDGIQSDFFPDCGPNVVLEGYTFTSGMFPMMTIEVLSETDYLSRLQGMFASVDHEFTDEHGGGSPTVLGVKKCGGSWTIVWTVALSENGAPAERTGASFEFVTADLESDDWFTEGLWLTPLSFPGDLGDSDGHELDRIGCDDVAVPWPS